NTILIDDSYLKAAMQPFNIIQPARFHNKIKNDRELKKIIEYLEIIKFQSNSISDPEDESEKRLFNLEQEIRKKSLFNLNNESSIEVSSSPFSNTSLKELEEEYNKIYLSKIHLSEKYIIAKQSSELLNGKIIKNSLINKKNEDIWTKDMLKLDWKLFNAPTTIQQVSNAWSRITSMNDCDFDNLLLKWYWELKKLQLKRSRLSNGATPSDILHTDNIVYDVHYNYLHYTKATSNKTLKFSTRHNGNVIHAFITREVSDYSEEDQEQLFDYQINFNYSLPRSTKIFQELIERINNPINENNDNELINGLSYDEIIIYGNSSSSHGNGDGSCNDVVGINNDKGEKSDKINLLRNEFHKFVRTSIVRIGRVSKLK
ncbi:7184_t:CDS:10, partial [Entrophospora sp. SA101]